MPEGMYVPVWWLILTSVMAVLITLSYILMAGGIIWLAMIIKGFKNETTEKIDNLYVKVDDIATKVQGTVNTVSDKTKSIANISEATTTEWANRAGMVITGITVLTSAIKLMKMVKGKK